MVQQKLQKKNFMVQKTSKICHVDVYNIVISKLIETKNNSWYMIGYFYGAINPFVLIFPKMSRYVGSFKNMNNELVSFHIDGDKQLKKYKTIWNRIEDLKKC